MNSKWYVIKKNDELPAGTDVFLCYKDREGDMKFSIGGYYSIDDSRQSFAVYDKMNDEIIDCVYAYMPFPKEIF